MLKFFRRTASPTEALNRRPAIEPLEQRRLLSITHWTVSPLSTTSVGEGITPSAAQPTVRAIESPANGATLDRDGFISASVNLVSQGNGVDANTLSTDTVKLWQIVNGQKVFVNSQTNTTGGGDGLVTHPMAILAANATYQWDVTSGVKDTAGNAFVPFSFQFNTNSNVANVDPFISFDKVSLPNAQGRQFSALAFGPDGRLYAGTLDGAILRYDVGADGQLGSPTVINTVKTNNGENRFIIGLAFDPAATAGNPILWVSHSQGVFTNATNFTGKISRLSGASLTGYTDYVVGLPRSIRDHLNNEIHFGSDGALYMGQAAMNSTGRADPTWLREDTPLSAAILRIDVANIASAVNVTTPDGGGTYNPNASGAPVTIVADGIRNSFDFVFHPNGHMYAASNGSFAGGNTPAGPGNDPPALTNLPITENDYVFDIVKGGYYGHPNPTRNHFVLNGGNPTSAVDFEEVAQYPVGTQPDPAYKHPALILGKDYAPTGMIVYQSNAFGGRLKNRILLARYSGGSDVIILTPSADGKTLSAVNARGLEGLANPIGIVEDTRNGNLYVSTNSPQGGLNIVLLKPHELPGISGLKWINTDASISFGALKNNAVLNLAAAPSRNISIRADTFGPVGSVRFALDGDNNFQIESFAPFGLRGNNANGTYVPWVPTLGAHTLTVTPYEGANATGTAGAAITWHFTITDLKLFKLNVNFQPSTLTTSFPKHRTDSGATFGRRANGFKYGWSALNSSNFFNRNSPKSYDERFDTGAAMAGRAWQMTVPNGKYSVYIAAGDPNDISGNYGIAVEGVLAISGRPTAKKPWLAKTITVTVRDGKLTVAPTAGSSGNKINFIQVSQIS